MSDVERFDALLVFRKELPIPHFKKVFGPNPRGRRKVLKVDKRGKGRLRGHGVRREHGYVRGLAFDADDWKALVKRW